MTKKKNYSAAYRIYWIIIRLSRNNGIFRTLIDYLAYLFYITLRRNKVFIFRNKQHKYFYHLYNRTVAGERIVEIPIIYDILKKYKNKRILEVGNVLSHYFPVSHTVLDKYERSPGVINKDVANVKLGEKFDLIFSISTLEHVGFNYGERKDYSKFMKGIRNLKKHLKSNGMLIITLPMYFNPNITRLIIERKMPLSKEYFLRRHSFLNEWKEVSYNEAVKSGTYDGHFANSNSLYIGMFKNK